MKKKSISSSIELVFNETEKTKLKFMKFLVDYFINNHISEVNLKHGKFSGENEND